MRGVRGKAAWLPGQVIVILVLAARAATADDLPMGKLAPAPKKTSAKPSSPTAAAAASGAATGTSQAAPTRQSRLSLRERTSFRGAKGDSDASGDATGTSAITPIESLWPMFDAEPGVDGPIRPLLPVAWFQSASSRWGRSPTAPPSTRWGRSPTAPPSTAGGAFRPEGYLKPKSGYFHLVQVAPEQPLAPAISPEPSAGVTPEQPLLSVARATFGFSGPSSAPLVLTQERADYVQSISQVSSATNERALSVSARPDLAQAVADEVLAVQTMWRSSISEAPFIRGYKNRQIYAQLDGQYFEPVRWDLDTILNKIDPGIVQDIIVVEGPYAVQYGPGFTFMDIVTRQTPRNQPNQYRTSMSWLPNGQQWYGRETINGGTQNFGYRLSYGHRNANDYFAGNGTQIPSHYNVGDVLAELGYSLSSQQHVELTYRRQDMNHTAYPGEFFDVSSLATNAFNVRYIDEDVTQPWTRLTSQAWYNQNNLAGNTFNSTKQPIVTSIEKALTASFYPNFAAGFGADTTNAALNPNLPPVVGFAGGTVGNLMSTGGRVIAQFGELDEVSLTTGVDVRVINQRVSEYFTINPFFSNNLNGFNTTLPPNLVPNPPAPPVPPSINPLYPFQFTTGMPRATSTNPGGFAEMTLPWTTYFRSKVGGRADWVDTNAYFHTVPVNGPPNAAFFPPTSALPAGPLNKANGLYAFYLTNQLDLTQHWNAAFSFGQSQRPPSLIDRYADGMFLGIIQSGFRRLIGDPNLAPERNWQIDAQVNGNYEKWRGFLRGYNSWVVNYITYSANSVKDPTGAVLLNTLNTPLAELRGFEAFNSFDLTSTVTPFASAHYVYGMDQTIHQPLTQIPPLQGFAGVRFHDANAGTRWGLEVFATMTRQQNRPGVLRTTDLPGQYTQIEQRVGGWTTANMRGYWNVNRNLLVSGGINNIFDRNYIQFLSLQTPPLQVLSPGISPYMSMEWIY